MKIIKTSIVALIVLSLCGSPFAGHCYEHLAPQTRFRSAIQQALEQAREDIEAGRVEETYGLVAELVEDLQTWQATQEIQPIMAKWNDKMNIPPEERVELRLEDLAAVLQEAEALLASIEPVVWEEITRQFPDRTFTEKQKTILLYLYGLGVRHMDRVLKRNPATLRHSLDRKIKPIIAYLRSLEVKELGHVIEENPGILSRNLEGKIKPIIAYLQSLNVKELGHVIEVYPPLPSINLEDKIKPIIVYLERRQVKKIDRVIEAFPQVLSLSLEDKIKPTIKYLRRQGVKKIGHVIEASPSVLGLSLEDKIKPAVVYLRRRMGKKVAHLIETFPAVLGYNLADKLKPTIELLAKIRGDTKFPYKELQQLLIRNITALTLIMEVWSEADQLIRTVKEIRSLYYRLNRAIKRQTGLSAAKWVRARAKDPATQQAIKELIHTILLGHPTDLAEGRTGEYL